MTSIYPRHRISAVDTDTTDQADSIWKTVKVYGVHAEAARNRLKGDRMKRFEKSISINAPAAKVFAYVSDFARHGEWSDHGLKVSREGSGPVAVGTTFSTEAKLLGTQREKSTVTTMNPPKEFGWESSGALGRVHHWFSLREDGGATSLAKGAEFVAPKFLAKMTMFKISKDLPKALDSDLSKIKAAVEG
jgi:polyketide cyclase/dehydrase/lipid transport protein